MALNDQITEDSIAALVDAFYARVRRDPELGPVFEAAVEDWPEHLATLTDFWSSVMLSSGRYHGRPMQVHARLSSLRPEMFERWLALWDQTVGERFTPEAAALFTAKAARIGQSLKYGLFFDPADIAPRARRSS